MTRKAILAGAAMMMFAGIPAAAEAANALTSATVNFRASPSGAVIGTIPNGAPVTVLGRSGNWCQTEWRGHVGWVHCHYVHAAVAQAPQLAPHPYYHYDHGYPLVYGGPAIGFAFGFGDFDRGFRHRHHRPHRFGGGHYGRGGGHFGSRAGSGQNGYLRALQGALN